MSKNNLDKLGLVDSRTYTQKQLMEQFNKMKTSNLTEEYNNIKIIYIENNKEKETILNIADKLNVSNPSTNSDTILSTADHLPQPVQDRTDISYMPGFLTGITGLLKYSLNILFNKCFCTFRK
jgi:hypothetical protein